MSSRQEEKEQRRQERLARVEAESAATARRKRLQFVFGGLLSVVIVAGVVVLLATSVFGGDTKAAGSTPDAKANIPAQQTSDIKAAASAAGCKLVDAPIEGNTHETKDFKASDYKTNPPTSGNHNPVWYQDGVYAPGDTPKLGMIVHPLEHGRIELQYKVGTPTTTVNQLETLMNKSDDGYHMLLFQNTTNMPFAVAAAAWGHYVGCPTMNSKVFDAIRTFRASYIDKGPEIVP